MGVLWDVRFFKISVPLGTPERAVSNSKGWARDEQGIRYL